MKIKITSLLLTLLLPALACEAGKLTKITSTDLSGATATFDGADLVVDNMRISSSTTDSSDFVRGTFAFSNSTENFEASNFEVFENVGVFNFTDFDNFFATNSTTAIVLKDNKAHSYQENETYSVTTSQSPFTASLHVGQVISFNAENIADDIHFTAKAPDGTIAFDDYLPANSSLITGGIPVLQTGAYTFSFARVGSSAVSFDFAFGNANRQELETVTSGSYLETNFRSNLRDYSKYRVSLTAGEKLEVDAPSDDGTRIALLNSKSAFEADSIGLPIVYVAATTGTYYLFICDSRAYGNDYDGYVTISKASADEAAQAAAGGNPPHVALHSSAAKPK